jgi:hypothetical protein
LGIHYLQILSDPDSLEAKAYLVLGRLTFEYSILESYLSRLLLALLKADEHAGNTVLSQLSFRTILTSVEALYPAQVKDKRQVSQMSATFLEIENLEARRNQLIHSFWQFDPPNRKIVRRKSSTKPNRGMKVLVESVDPTQVHELCNEIVHATIKVMDAANELNWRRSGA